MTLRSSDLQTDSDLDNIRNSSDVFAQSIAPVTLICLYVIRKGLLSIHSTPDGTKFWENMNKVKSMNNKYAVEKIKEIKLSQFVHKKHN